METQIHANTHSCTHTQAHKGKHIHTEITKSEWIKTKKYFSFMQITLPYIIADKY